MHVADFDPRRDALEGGLIDTRDGDGGTGPGSERAHVATLSLPGVAEADRFHLAALPVP